jgi:glycosyltransferase involved in cell wall biosynthesis
MAERVIEMGVACERIHFVPNWTDQEQLEPVSAGDNSFRRQQGWDGKFVVLYSGNIGVSHYFDDILEAARRLRTRTEIMFAFVGGGMRQREVTRFKIEHGLDNIRLLPFQSMPTLALSLASGDLHFVSLRPGFEGVVVPSKTYGALAAGRPVLYQGDDDGEIARLIAENDVGAVVAPGHVDELTSTILRYAQDTSLVARQGRRARWLVETRFSKKKAIDQYTEILKDLSVARRRQ